MARPTKDPRIIRLNVRLTRKEMNRIRGLAKLYARGDVSRWVRHGAINAPRRKLR